VDRPQEETIVTATMTHAIPIIDLMHDWLTVIPSRYEGLNAHKKYIEDAEK
jgi:hypothetical protein